MRTTKTDPIIAEVRAVRDEHAARFDPRARGGASEESRPALGHVGLSPRTRGSQTAFRVLSPGKRSIPAHAGGSPSRLDSIAKASGGLSPRTRGSPL